MAPNKEKVLACFRMALCLSNATMRKTKSGVRRFAVAGICQFVAAGCSLLFVSACGGGSDDPATDEGAVAEHEVFFAGYSYDGATGRQLTAMDLSSISIQFGGETITTTIAEDGRFTTDAPLPTWQDYTVLISGPAFRPFVSHNPGIGLPEELSMTEGASTAKTTQTFQVEAYLFPANIVSPPLVLTIDKADATLGSADSGERASGVIRFTPISTSLVELEGAVPSRRWLNSQDSRHQIISKPFTGGQVQIAEGELVYGVAYEIVVFGVEGYQPAVMSQPLVAGSVASRTVVIQTALKDPLRVVAMDAEDCEPPAGAATEYTATVSIAFSEAVEFVGSNAQEIIDNGISIAPQGSRPFPSTSSYCSLNSSLSPVEQERGSRAQIEGNVLTLSFNPSLGINNQSGVFTCEVPESLTYVMYGNLDSVSVQPVGDPSRLTGLDDVLRALVSPAVSRSGARIVCGIAPTSLF